MLRDLDKLEGWAITKHMKFNKRKCQTLLVVQGDLGYLYRPGDKRLESSPAERDLGVLVSSKLNTTQQSADCMLWCISLSIASQLREVHIPLCCCWRVRSTPMLDVSLAQAYEPQ